MSAKVLLGLMLLVSLLLGSLSTMGTLPLNYPKGAPFPEAVSTFAPSFPSYYYSPRVQKYTFIAFHDPTSEFTALQGGSIDAMDWPLTSSQESTLWPTPQYQVNVSNDLGMIQVIFDAGRYPSNFTAYRQAVSLMIDRFDVLITALQGRGGVMPDQLAPSWPAAYHVPGGAGWDMNLALANKTLYAGGFVYNSSLNRWYNTGMNYTHCGSEACPTPSDPAVIQAATTIFYSRSDDPVRLYVGVQLAVMQGATKATYHFDSLFTVSPVTSYITAKTAYRAPESSGGYNDNNCNGSGFPCFTAYTQSLSFALPDPAWMRLSFGSTYMDVSYRNFGHWANSTINSLAESFYFDSVLNSTKVQLLNKYVTEQAWWDPLYYQQLYNGLSERVTGHLSGQNSVVPNGPFAYTNEYSFWRAHLKGRLYGGSIRVGIYNPINQLNIFNPDSNWPQDDIVLYRIYDSLLHFNYDTGGYTSGLAISYSVSTFTAPVYNSQFGAGARNWETIASAPYWQHNNTAYHTVSGTQLSYTLLSNATWQDGSPLTANDVMWNIVTDAVDRSNLLTAPYAFLDDVNVTGNTVNLYFNSTSYDLLLASALNPVVAPGPWINNAGGAAAWAGSAGIVSKVSLNSKASLCPAGGLSNMMLLGSGPYMFDCSGGDPFTVGTPFGLVAYNGYVYADPNKATYTTGIASMNEPYGTISIGGTVPIKVALVNGQNTKGLTFSGGKYIPDPTTVSDTTSGATVTASLYEYPSDNVTLAYNSASKLWEGNLSTTGVVTGRPLHVQITATKSGSLPTTYGPVGTSQASAVGVSWEGDQVNTAVLAFCCPPPCCGPPGTPVTPMMLLTTSILVAVVALSFRRRKMP